MLTAPQTDLVAHFEQLLPTGRAQAGQVLPRVVGPYAGQLLHMDALAAAVPALWVDLESGTLAAETEGGDVFSSGITAELVLATVNQATPGAGYSDGLALVSWALTALLSGPVIIGGRRHRPTGPVRWTRLASDARFWAGRISADLELDTDL